MSVIDIDNLVEPDIDNDSGNPLSYYRDNYITSVQIKVSEIDGIINNYKFILKLAAIEKSMEHYTDILSGTPDKERLLKFIRSKGLVDKTIYDSFSRNRVYMDNIRKLEQAKKNLLESLSFVAVIG